MSKKEPTPPPAEVLTARDGGNAENAGAVLPPRVTYTVSEGVTTIVEPTLPASPDTKETEDAQVPSRPARQG